ncbi:MAG TPA: hypothetical protein P5307_03655 [Pirellulaceae bacterium]|nr:hypothetical protein [Pirellulaceae bacterium]
MVYSAIGVVGIMVGGGFAWSQFTPHRATSLETSVADANIAASQVVPVVLTEEMVFDVQSVEIDLPWAPLPPEKRLPPETTPPSTTDESESPAISKSEHTAVASGDEISQEKDTDASFEDLFRADQFAAELERAVTLDFNPIEVTTNTNRRQTISRQPTEPLTQAQHFAQLANPSDLVGLPIVGEDQCHKSVEAVKELARVSRGMAAANRERFAQPSSFSLSHEMGVEDAVFKFIDESRFDSTSVSPLVQILQVGSLGVRMMLVETLSGIEGPEASRALADRAIFDLSQNVRAAAIDKLKHRERTDYRQRFLQALRYPLPAVAFRAAEVLVVLDDAEALPYLEGLLDEPDPSAPHIAGDGTIQKTEVVRVNHLRNCLLCHPHSVSRNDLVRGAIPTPGQQLSRGYGRSTSGDAVRAEVTYLRQDFSVMQYVRDSGQWPDTQRFDFLVRTRPLTEDERRADAALDSVDTNAVGSYPQREAVLLAIKGLRGIGD